MSEEMMTSKLASNIRHLRKQLSFSQEELAAKLGLNRGNIASYEKGTAEPKICNLLNLSNFYKVSVIDLTTRDLRCPIALEAARAHYQYELKEEDKTILEKFFIQAEELQTVMKSVKVCHRFKLKSLEKLPPDFQPIIANFDQLCTAGEMLMKMHMELLDFIKKRMK